MSDNLPPWVSYANDQANAVRKDLGERIDKLGGELVTEAKARADGDTDLAEDITKLTTSRLTRSSTAVKWVLGFLIAGVVTGVVTVVVAYFEALGHLTGGIP